MVTMFLFLLFICSVCGFQFRESQNEVLLSEGSPCVKRMSSNVLFNGTCVNFYQCLDVIAGTLLRRRLKQDLTICSFDGIVPIVCCTSCKLVNNVTDAVIAKTGQLLWKTGKKSWDKCLEYSSRLPLPCEPRSRVAMTLDKSRKCYNMNRMVPHVSGGRNAARKEFPHMALLGYGDDLPDAQWACGGTIISEDFVLTAAHCRAYRDEVKYVAVGILKRTDAEHYWQTRTVKEFIIHPEYRFPSKYHDIALLRVDKPFKFHEHVLPACLHSPVFKEEMSSPLVKIEATGWGSLGHKKDLAEHLQAVALKELSLQECSRQYGRHRNLEGGFNRSTQMCFGDANKDDKLYGDTCEGDSGGPLQFLSPSTCLHVVIGVTSYGRACGFQHGAGIYTRVEHYIDWIESVVWP